MLHTATRGQQFSAAAASRWACARASQAVSHSVSGRQAASGSAAGLLCVCSMNVAVSCRRPLVQLPSASREKGAAAGHGWGAVLSHTTHSRRHRTAAVTVPQLCVVTINLKQGDQTETHSPSHTSGRTPQSQKQSLAYPVTQLPEILQPGNKQQNTTCWVQLQVLSRCRTVKTAHAIVQLQKLPDMTADILARKRCSTNGLLHARTHTYAMCC